MKTLAYSLILAGALAFECADAQAPSPAPTPPPAQAAKAATPQAEHPATPTAKEPEKPKTIDELTKDFVKQTGVLTVYRKQKDGSDTIYLEVPENKIGTLMLLQETAASGLGDTPAFVFHGMPLNDLPIKFGPLRENAVDLLSPNLDHRGETEEAQRGIARSFPDTVLGTFEIKARQPDRKSFLVDVSNFFRSDVGDLSAAVMSVPGKGFMLDPAGSRVDTVKDFPDNLVVRTVYRLNRMGPPSAGPKSVPWAVSFNLSELPQSDYRPRLGDPRVGFFTVNYQDLTDARNYDPNVNYILRWNLQKADPTLPLSPPKKPIVFWIDNAVPKEYRAAVRKGLMMYDEAFESLGIKDAVVVKQMPDDADWDIADLRYNVVRWTTGMPFAIALFRANPLTGEILNASINMDAGFASSGAIQFDQVVDPNIYRHTASPVSAKWANRLCDLEEEGKIYNTMGAYAMELLDPQFTPGERQKFIEQYITEVVGHEFGHCLGLRHNFAASTEFDGKQLGEASVVDTHGLGASIMDYTPFNLYAVGKKGVDFYSQHIGTYDKWAIQYGYTPIAATSPQGELPALKAIASNDGLPGHQYQSDAAADDFDPYVERFDLAKDPVETGERSLEVGRALRAKAYKKLKSGDSYYEFTKAWLAGLSYQTRAVTSAFRYIGGGRLGSGFVGDPNGKAPYTPIDAARQRRALKLITDALLSEHSFDLSRQDMAKLTFNPNTKNNETSGRSRLYPLFNRLAAMESSAVAELLDSDTLSRMQDNQFRVGPHGDTLGLSELFTTLGSSVWSEVFVNRPVSDLRRELQRSYLGVVLPMSLGQVPGAPNDARDLALVQVKGLRSAIAAALPKTKDAYTRAHYEECLGRIDRALKAGAVVPVGQ